ncbi:MAG: DNA ligase [Pseudoxanthomonas sp.]
MRQSAFAPLLLSLCLLAPVHPLQAGTAPPLMLASGYQEGLDVSRYLVSEKLDGVRGYWDGKAMWTRGGAKVTPPAWFTRDWPAVPMDGELWIGRGRFDEVSALVRRTDGDPQAWRAVRFMVFDLPSEPRPFVRRAALIVQRVKAAGNSQLVALKQDVVADGNALHSRLALLVREGGEGLMLHRQDAVYGIGRSDALLKYKPFDDAEARVVAHVEGKGRLAGKLGSLVVQLSDGRRFRLGSGFTDAQRAAPPPIGSWVTYRHSGKTSTGLPRFARFLRMRDELPPVEVAAGP